MVLSKHVICPNLSSIEWKLLVQSQNGDPEKAFGVWEDNNFDFPQHIIDQVIKASTVESSTESYTLDPYIAEKHKILERSKGVLKHKAKKMAGLARKNPNFEENNRELIGLLKDMDRLEVDFALHKFILAADRMSSSTEKWMDSILSGEKDITIEGLKRMQEVLDSFDLLKDLKEDFFRRPEHKKDFEIISKILDRQNKIRTHYLTIARKRLAQQFAPHFGKIEAEYRLLAEKKFNKEYRKNEISKGNKGNDLTKIKQDYIENFMMAHAAEIFIKRDKYVHDMLISTVDLGNVTNILINPKDMDHDMMGMAVEMIDKADYDISQATINKTREAQKLYEDFVKYVGKQNDPRKQYESILIQMADEDDPDHTLYTVPVLMNPDYYGWEDFKKKYEGTPIWNLQQFLQNLSEEKDDLVFTHQKLGYRLPHINKENFERLATNGLVNTIKEGTIDKFKLRAEDTEFGNVGDRLGEKVKDYVTVNTNEAGKEREQVPLFYRVPVDPKEQSYDVVSAILLDYHNSLSFKTKNEVGATLEVLKDVINNSKVSVRTGFRKLKKKDKTTGLDVVIEGRASKLSDALESIIRHRVYGISVEGDPRVAKMVKTAANYTSILGLAVNDLAAVANFLQGSTVSWIESVGNKGTGVFNANNKAKAVAKYHKDIPGIIADIGERVPKSKTNLLIEKFNAMSDWQAIDKRFIENSRLKRNFNAGSLLALNSMGEHLIQSVTMLSILDNIKVQNSKGQYLNKDLQVVDNRDEAMSLDEAYFVNEDGELELPKEVAKTDKTDNINSEDDFKIAQLIRRVNRDLYGNYDSNNKSQLQKHALGALLMQMRGWLLPGFQKRWRDFGTFTQRELSTDQRSYNQETKQFEEGTYTTTFRFLNNLRQDLKVMKLMAVPENWNSLTDQEKSNIRKATLEIAAAAVLFGISTGLRDSDDKEDIYLAFLSRRLYSELTSFINPLEAVRTFRSPMIVLNTTEDLIKFLLQLLDPTERYETGREAGELKLKERFIKLVPIWKQLDRTAEEALIFLEK